MFVCLSLLVCVCICIFSLHDVWSDAKRAWKGHQYGSKGSIFEITFSVVLFNFFACFNQRWWNVNPNQRREQNLNKKAAGRKKRYFKFKSVGSWIVVIHQTPLSLLKSLYYSEHRLLISKQHSNRWSNGECFADQSLVYCQRGRENEVWKMSSTHMFQSYISMYTQKSLTLFAVKVLFLSDGIFLCLFLCDFTLFF